MMSKLIEEFKSEHAALVSLLIEIKRLDVHSKETRIKLLKAKNHLLTHLEKEDHNLYPVLRKASEGSHNIKRISGEIWKI
jgi:hemerythrin-like domain-containing protein